MKETTFPTLSFLPTYDFCVQKEQGVENERKNVERKRDTSA